MAPSREINRACRGQSRRSHPGLRARTDPASVQLFSSVSRRAVIVHLGFILLEASEVACGYFRGSSHELALGQHRSLLLNVLLLLPVPQLPRVLMANCYSISSETDETLLFSHCMYEVQACSRIKRETPEV